MKNPDETDLDEQQPNRFALDEPFEFTGENRTGKRHVAKYDDPAEGRKVANSYLTGYGRNKGTRTREKNLQPKIELAKQQYITSEKCPTIKQLSEAFGVADYNIRQTATREDWLTLRNNFQRELLNGFEEELKTKLKQLKQNVIETITEQYQVDKFLPLVDAMYEKALKGNVQAFKAFLELFGMYDKPISEAPKIAIQNNINLEKLEEIAKKSGFIKE